MFIKPSPGIIIRDPFNQQVLPVSGVEVSGNESFWIRRLKDGSVVLGDKSPQKTAPTVAKDNEVSK